jgi:hypothetical protein
LRRRLEGEIEIGIEEEREMEMISRIIQAVHIDMSDAKIMSD